MIITEQLEINGHDFIRTTSSENRYVVREGISYEEACDPAELGRIYTEGDVIPTTDADAEELLGIILGGNQ